MSCRYLEDRLEALLAETLPPVEATLCAQHLETCGACRDLVELARLTGAAAGGEAESEAAARLVPDLVPAVLARTGSGTGACGRARELLAAAVDEPLENTDRRLLQGHLAACGDCRVLSGVLLALARDLPRLAEVHPDAGFVDDVLRRTLPFETQIRRWWDALWPQLWHRPQFASEAAYLGLVVLVLVFVTPGSPLGAVPYEALAIAQDAPLRRIDLPAVDLEPRIAATARALRDSKSARVAADWSAGVRETADETVQVLIEIRTHLGTFWEEAASLLETGDDTPSSTSGTSKETS
ncbi:MAG: zf-HC2 domain-containing protein [Thermoanaerobaculia bacterium]